MAKTFTLKGGDKLAAKLKELSAKAKKSSLVKVGFFEGSMERENDVPSAYVAYINEFGGTVPARTVPEHTVSIYRRVNKEGEFLNKARFIKRSASNFETEHVVPEHTIPEHTIPARPFFRNMIAKGEKHWGNDLAKNLAHYDFDADKSMAAMGLQMSEELQDSIKAREYVENAPSTIAKKGHDQTLVDSGDMLNAVDYNVD